MNLVILKIFSLYYSFKGSSSTQYHKVLETNIYQRVAYAETAARGTTAIEEDPNSLAGQEIKKLTEEIVKEAKIQKDIRE